MTHRPRLLHTSYLQLPLAISRFANRFGVRDLDVPLRYRSFVVPLIDAAERGQEATVRDLAEALPNEILSYLDEAQHPLRARKWNRSTDVFWRVLREEREMRDGRRANPWPVAHHNFWAPTGLDDGADARRRSIAAKPDWSETDPALLTQSLAQRALNIVATIPSSGAEHALDSLGLLLFEEIEAGMAHAEPSSETSYLFGLQVTPLEILGLERSLRLGGWSDPTHLRSYVWWLLPNANTFMDPNYWVPRLDPESAIFLIAMRRVHIQRGYDSSYDDWHWLHEREHRVEPQPSESLDDAFDRTLRERRERLAPRRKASVDRIRSQRVRQARRPGGPSTPHRPRVEGCRLLGAPPAPSRSQRVWRAFGSRRLSRIGRAQFEDFILSLGEDDSMRFANHPDVVREGDTWVNALTVSFDIAVSKIET